jgi:transposase-like protein
MSNLSAPHFHNEEAAYAYIEARVWPQGPVCPHCGCFGRIYEMKGKSTRIGVRKCGDCRKPFNVKVGTIFESSHVPMRHWLQAMYLMAASKKGVSANQLHRTLGCTLKTAWFLAHRIREAMATGALSPFGAGGTAVEVDETFFGDDPDMPSPTKHTRVHNKNKIVTLVDRASGRAKSYVVDRLNTATITEIVSANVAREAHLMTDEAHHYITVGRTFASHGVTRHRAEEYVRDGDPLIHSNTVEGFYSIFKRGMRGVYQHASKRHLHRYVAEFDFRYSNRIAVGVNDIARTDILLAGVVGKRLTYRTTRGQA